MNALLRCFLMNGVAYTEGRSPAGVWPIYLERALSPRQRVDHSRKLCVCFYSSLYEVQAAERAQTWISKGEEQALLPLGQHWEGIRHRPSHPWLYSAFVGGQRGFRLPLFAPRGGSGSHWAHGAILSEFTSLITPRRRRIFVFILKPRLLISVGVRCWNMLFQKLSVLGALNVGAWATSEQSIRSAS